VFDASFYFQKSNVIIPKMRDFVNEIDALRHFISLKLLSYFSAILMKVFLMKKGELE
jgi:hypothetical protein